MNGRKQPSLLDSAAEIVSLLFIVVAFVLVPLLLCEWVVRLARVSAGIIASDRRFASTRGSPTPGPLHYCVIEAEFEIPTPSLPVRMQVRAWPYAESVELPQPRAPGKLNR